MTGPEWERCDDPRVMFGYLSRCRRRRPTQRQQLLLFACACCRRVLHRIPGDWARQAIDVAQAVADGAADPGAVEAACPNADNAHDWSGGIITPAEQAVFAVVWADVGRQFGI